MFLFFDEENCSLFPIILKLNFFRRAVEVPAPITSAVYAGRKYALEVEDSLSVHYLVCGDINLSN